MSEDSKEFRRRVLKLSEKRVHKITNSVGVREAYRWCKKNKAFGNNTVPETDFYKIVRETNKLLSDELLESRDVNLPQKMGMLEVRKIPIFVKFVDGEVKTNRGINWNATLELWRTDEEARESKTLVRSEGSNSKFLVFYNRNKANYPNKTLICFKPVRTLYLELNNRAKQGLIDAFNLYGK